MLVNLPYISSPTISHLDLDFKKNQNQIFNVRCYFFNPFFIAEIYAQNFLIEIIINK